ncbi:winged helix-turn-helix transcriptional regulator [Kutzneria sp. CA-103260]|uniref:winged helix-turn-helix transcriptional regulator n=1 Tax=Kutzneria sp. CA-103260 TaxID=2802641 RepID=UPI001BAD4EBE|nr:helix-turn-helix domain-containing protein [Kutzneria sp. CA-103260]QUQ72436.1 transcriptional regulator family protein [Kutzneria sp. CA-103260]
MATSRTDLANLICSIARSLEVVGPRWTLLIMREALSGKTRFAEFRDVLGIAPDVLSERLNTLVKHGVLTKQPYQEHGSRARFGYHPTPAGRELVTVIGALQQWGDIHLPRKEGPSMQRRSRLDNSPLHVGFINAHGNEVGIDNVDFVKTAAHPLGSPPARPPAD